MTVAEPEATTSPYPQVTMPSTEMYFVASTAAIIIAVAIAAAAIILLQRKRP
jgi:hypothetical protein